MCGAKGASNTVKGSRICRLLHSRRRSSFTQIIKWLTHVLNEKRSISSVTRLMAVCRIFNSSGVGSDSLTLQLLPLSKNKSQALRRKLYTPLMPFVSQGFDCSMGPKNISYMRKVSAPYFSTTSSGLMTLYLDLDIFPTSECVVKPKSDGTSSAINCPPL